MSNPAVVIVGAVITGVCTALALIQRIWGGLLDVSADSLPVIDSIPDYRGLIVASGFSGQKFVIGAAVGEKCRGLVPNKTSQSPFDAFRFDRFCTDIDT